MDRDGERVAWPQGVQARVDDQGARDRRGGRRGGPPGRPDHDPRRRVTREEYEAVVDCALDLEFENLFIQEVDEQNLVPDFDRAEPFAWK